MHRVLTDSGEHTKVFDGRDGRHSFDSSTRGVGYIKQACCIGCRAGVAIHLHLLMLSSAVGL